MLREMSKKIRGKEISTRSNLSWILAYAHSVTPIWVNASRYPTIQKYKAVNEMDSLRCWTNKTYFRITFHFVFTRRYSSVCTMVVLVIHLLQAQIWSWKHKQKQSATELRHKRRFTIKLTFIPIAKIDVSSSAISVYLQRALIYWTESYIPTNALLYTIIY